jgi:hypothetical protein
MADKEITEKILRTPVTAVCRKGHDWSAEMWDRPDPLAGTTGTGAVKVKRTVQPEKCPICGLKFDYIERRRLPPTP